MRTCFGAAVTSLASVQAAVEKKYGETKVAVAFFPLHIAPSKEQEQHLKQAKVVLIPGVSNLRRFWPLLKASKGVGIVFDGPVNLQEVRDLRFLDIDRRPRDQSLSYLFKLKPFDYPKLFNKINSKKPVKFKMDSQKLKLLPYILEVRANGGLMETINNLIYFNSSLENRRKIKVAILSYFKHDLSRAKLEKVLIGLSEANEPRRKLIKIICDFLVSEKGKKLSKGVDEAFAYLSKVSKEKSDKPRAIPYSKIVKKVGLANKIDLKAILSLHRELLLKD